MEIVRVRETILREQPAPPRPEVSRQPRWLRRVLARRAYRYAIRIALFVIIVMAVLLLFPAQAH